MKTEMLEERCLAYIRVTGPYGENYEPAIDKLCQWADVSIYTAVKS